MKYARYIILLVIFISITVYFNSNSDKKWEDLDKYLDNNVLFEGVVMNVKQSNNHAFGIIQLKLTKSNIKEFNKVIKEGIYPYRIKGDVGELYTAIPDGLKKFDFFIVDSNSHKYKFEYKKERKIYNSVIYIIIDTYDIDFVKDNTIFR